MLGCVSSTSAAVPAHSFIFLSQEKYLDAIKTFSGPLKGIDLGTFSSVVTRYLPVLLGPHRSGWNP